MNITYTNLDFSDLRGDLVADYLVSVDAHLTIAEGARTIYEEPGFPVAELARSLSDWLGTADRDSFEFDSLSADERGIVTISEETGDWQVYSSFTPKVRSSLLPWTAVEGAVRDFIGNVREDLTERGIDADRIVGSPPPAGGSR